MVKSIIIFIIVFFIVTTINPNIYSQDWGKISPEEWGIQPPTKFPEANAVILFDKCHLKFQSMELIQLIT